MYATIPGRTLRARLMVRMAGSSHAPVKIQAYTVSQSSNQSIVPGTTATNSESAAR